MSDLDGTYQEAFALLRSGTREGRARAGDLFRAAADAGHTASANNLAAMLQHGNGTPQNTEEARFYYRLAAENGLTIAAFNYGFMLLQGEGGAVDREAAKHWFERAASGDPPDTDAMTHLGRLALLGEETPDFDTARLWWERGAELGDGRCAYNLGLAWLAGHGTEPAPVAAMSWLERAFELGNPDAQWQLLRILESVGPEFKI